MAGGLGRHFSKINEIEKKIEITADAFSQSAIEKIEKAGGSVIISKNKINIGKNINMEKFKQLYTKNMLFRWTLWMIIGAILGIIFRRIL